MRDYLNTLAMYVCHGTVWRNHLLRRVGVGGLDTMNAKKLCEERNWRVGDMLLWHEGATEYLARVTGFGESVVVLRRPKCAEFIRSSLPDNTTKIPRVKARAAK